MGFESNMNHGVKFEFANGYCVSVQYGSMHACFNRGDFGCETNLQLKSPNAEVAIWHKSESEHWATGAVVSAMGLRADNMDDQGIILGYVSPDTVAQIMAHVAAMAVPNA